MLNLLLRLRSTLILLRHDRMPLGAAWRRAGEIWRKNR
jgi:hypothetical protein